MNLPLPTVAGERAQMATFSSSMSIPWSDYPETGDLLLTLPVRSSTPRARRDSAYDGLPTNIRVDAEGKIPPSGSRLEETEGRRTREEMLAGASLTQKAIAVTRTSHVKHRI